MCLYCEGVLYSATTDNAIHRYYFSARKVTKLTGEDVFISGKWLLIYF